MPRLFTSLRAALLVPFVIVIALVAGTISLLSYKTGLEAVDELSEHLLLDISNRVVQATTRQLASSSVMLNVLAPPLGRSDTDPSTGRLLPTTLADFEQRMWIACNLFADERAWAIRNLQATIDPVVIGDGHEVHSARLERIVERARRCEAIGQTDAPEEPLGSAHAVAGMNVQVGFQEG